MIKEFLPTEEEEVLSTEDRLLIIGECTVVNMFIESIYSPSLNPREISDIKEIKGIV